MGYIGLYIEDWVVEVQRHWVAGDCCCGRRSFDDFSNRGCRYLSMGFPAGVGCNSGRH